MNNKSQKVVHELSKWFISNKFSEFKSFYLFGSLVNDEGLTFEREKSDIDIVIQFSSNCINAVQRRNAILSFAQHVIQLEIKLIKLLERVQTNVSITSILPVTQLEIDFNIHKTITDNFFSKEQFLDILKKEVHKFNIPNITISKEYAPLIMSMKDCQKLRNKFLKINLLQECGIENFTNEKERLPKYLLRCAGRVAKFIRPNISNDSIVSEGLPFITSIINKRLNHIQNEEYKRLRKLITLNYGEGNLNISPVDILLISEVIFDEIVQIIKTKSDFHDVILKSENIIYSTIIHEKKSEKVALNTETYYHQIKPFEFKKNDENFLFQTKSFILQKDIPLSIKSLEVEIRMKLTDFLPKQNAEKLIKTHSYAYLYLSAKFKILTSIAKKIKELKQNFDDNYEEIYEILKGDLQNEINDLREIQEIIRDVEAIILKEKLNDLEEAKQQYCGIYLLEDDILDTKIVRRASKVITSILTRIEDLKKFMKEMIILGNNHDN